MFFFFFFNDTATTEIYTLSLHDALPIYRDRAHRSPLSRSQRSSHPIDDHVHRVGVVGDRDVPVDRKSTRLNSSHRCISYAVFCLKKKKKKKNNTNSVLKQKNKRKREEPK